jgi:hypothetical protein
MRTQNLQWFGVLAWQIAWQLWTKYQDLLLEDAWEIFRKAWSQLSSLLSWQKGEVEEVAELFHLGRTS